MEVSSGKVEIGQGILTAVAQIVADELDVELSRVRMMPATTAASPNEGVTSGSLSIQQSGVALRYACAEARAIHLDAAAQRLGVDVQSIEVRDGEIVGPGNLRTSYWELAEHETGRGLLDRDATARIAPKPAAARRLAGAAAQRIDIPDKVFGRPRFVHDLALPGLLHSRVLRPPSLGATLAALDETGAKAVPGVVAVARDGSFAGVVAETEDAALAGLKALAASATWQPGDALPDEGNLPAWIRSQPVETTPINTREAAVRRARPAPCAARTRGRSSPTPRWPHPAPSRSGRTGACASGHIPRASTTCAPTWSWSSGSLPRGSWWSTPRAPAATARTAPTTWPWRRRCWRAQPRAVRCGCCGRARTSWPGRPWAPRSSWTSRPISTRRARSSPGAMTFGATATSRAPAAARRPRCRPLGSSPSRSRGWSR